MSLRAQTVPRPISVCGLCTLDKPWLMDEVATPEVAEGYDQMVKPPRSGR
jgi:hypothetical protein